MFTATIISLSERWSDWRYMLAFVLPAAEQRVQALQFVQIERDVANAGRDQVRLSQTKTSFMMGPEMAARVCQAFVDACLLSRVSNSEDKVYTPTPKGLHLVDKFVTRHGIATEAADNLLNMHAVCDKLLFMERDAQDNLQLSDGVVRVAFQRLIGTSGSRELDSALGMAMQPDAVCDADGTQHTAARFEGGHVVHWLLHFTTLVSADEAVLLAAHMVRLGWLEAEAAFLPEAQHCATVHVDRAVCSGTAHKGTFSDAFLYHVTKRGANVAWVPDPPKMPSTSTYGGAVPEPTRKRGPFTAPAPTPSFDMPRAGPKLARITWHAGPGSSRPGSSLDGDAASRGARADTQSADGASPALSTPTVLANARAFDTAPDANVTKPTVNAEPQRSAPAPAATPYATPAGAGLGTPAPALFSSASVQTPAMESSRTSQTPFTQPRDDAPGSSARAQSPAGQQQPTAAPRAYDPATAQQKLSKVLHKAPLRLKFQAFLAAHGNDEILRFWCAAERFRAQCRLASSGALRPEHVDVDAVQQLNFASVAQQDSSTAGIDAPTLRAAQRSLLATEAKRMQPSDSVQAVLSQPAAAELSQSLQEYSVNLSPRSALGERTQASHMMMPSPEVARDHEKLLARVIVASTAAQKEVFRTLAETALPRFLQSPA